MTLDEIEKLCDEATPGPWGCEYQQFTNGPLVKIMLDSEESCIFHTEWSTKATTEFIAFSRVFMPQFIAIVKQADLIIEEARGFDEIGHKMIQKYRQLRDELEQD